MIQSAEKFSEQISYNFQNFQNLESSFQKNQIPNPKKSVFWPGDVFGIFLGPKNHRFVYHFLIFYEFGEIHDKS